MNFWKDKVVIITGSSIGIGRCLANLAAKQGAKLVLNGRNKERLDQAVSELTTTGTDTIGVAGDVSKFKDCELIKDEALRAYGKIDVLINNAGLASQTDIEDIDPIVFQTIIDVNISGTVFMSKAVLGSIKESKGSILFIGSVAGIHGIGGYAAYSSSKMALKGITEALRIELYNDPVHIGLAYVGFTENDPKKTFLDAKGNAVSLPSRSAVKQEPVEVVAQRLMDMVEHRKNKLVFGTMGKVTAIVHRFMPSILRRILLNAYKKG